MSKRQKLWAAGRRQQLIKEYGGACEHCGSPFYLTFDLRNPTRERTHHRMDSSERMSFYNGQHAKRNLMLLCRSCNARKKNHKPGRRS